MYRMLKAQFEKLRDGDYYYFMNDPYLQSSVRNSIRNTKFSDVLKRNTTITNLQSNVFFTQECPGSTVRIAADKNETKPITVYPNPVSSVINVNTGDYENVSRVDIYDGNGRLVKTISHPESQKEFSIPAEDLTAGLYMLNVFTGEEVKTFKIMKAGN
jgi:hypothetical protein